MTPTSTRAGRAAALTAAVLALACCGAAPAQARQDPEPESLPSSGPGSPLEIGNRTVAEVHFDHGALAARDDLRRAGARILDAGRREQVVTVAAAPGKLEALRSVEGVAGANRVLTPVTSGVCGSVNSEGDTHLAAAEARADFGVDGAGVGVGILSDSFDNDSEAPTHAAQDILSGDLPGPGNPCGYPAPTQLIDDSRPGEDEGRGMAQIVHDLAPGATLSFASAFAGEASFAENIRKLAAAGASVLVDDVAYFEEPFFQDGPVGVAINEVTAKGASYFTAAGNDNLISAGRNFASWETAEFRDAASCPPELLAETGVTEHCLDFDPGTEPGEEDNTFGITVEGKETLFVDLQWAEPWEGVDADIDAYLLDQTGKPIKQGGFIVGSTGNNVAKPGTAPCEEGAAGRPCQRPFELFTWKNTSAEDVEVQLVVDRCFEAGCNPEADPAAMPAVKVMLPQNGGGLKETEYLESSSGDVVGPAIYGHSGSAAAVSVGAVRAGVTDSPEPYSSRGPVRHYFGPVRADGEPAPADEEIVPKPDVAATDCGRTSFFVPSGPGIFRFCGTSASAPHAAAVAALARQANPSMTPAQIRVGLAASARPVGAFGPDAVGGGLIDAHRMLEDFALPPRISIVDRPPPLSNNPKPAISFVANRPAYFSCSLDGGVPLPCESPFVPLDALSDGPHGFAVRGEDLAGKVGVSETVFFVVDTTAPQTRIRRRPPRRKRTRRRRAKAVFLFAASEPGVRFTCRVDGGLVRFCPERFARRYSAGRHVLRVMAVDSVGNVDRTPAKYRFRVERVGRQRARHRSHSRRAP